MRALNRAARRATASRFGVSSGLSTRPGRLSRAAGASGVRPTGRAGATVLSHRHPPQPEPVGGLAYRQPRAARASFRSREAFPDHHRLQGRRAKSIDRAGP